MFPLVPNLFCGLMVSLSLPGVVLSEIMVYDDFWQLLKDLWDDYTRLFEADVYVNNYGNGGDDGAANVYT